MHFGSYALVLLNLKFVDERKHMRDRSVRGNEAPTPSCACPPDRCGCCFETGVSSFPSARHLQLTIHEQNPLREGWQSPPQRQSDQLQKYHGAAAVATILGCPCPRAAAHRAVAQYTANELAPMDGEALSHLLQHTPSDVIDAVVKRQPTTTYEKFGFLSKELIFIMDDSFGKALSVEDFQSKYGYMIQVFHHLRIQPKRCANPHWMSEGYGGTWALFRYAALLQIVLYCTTQTTWESFWLNVGIMRDDTKNGKPGVVVAAKGALSAVFPNGPKDFFDTFSGLESTDAQLLSICICNHKKDPRVKVAIPGSDEYVWNGK